MTWQVRPIETMVLILDGNSEHVAHALNEIGLFGEKQIRFVTALDLNKCFEYQNLHLTCAPISDIYHLVHIP